ncbi:redoxin domain-containing protein [Altererythrobacter gangjinensis]|uniref:Redoxin domain-containing protein n=1 Tax=Pontixanthobacter gangjinensis TaxID=1028742 RepID=A0A6I4SMX5_9SPHN|nr:redoxin domain-containing protein [Pontixanthobacter gangjinensis]
MRLSLTRNALLVAGLSLALGSCDREAANPAQEQGALAGAKQSLVGEIDTARAGELLPAMNVTDLGGKVLNLGALQGQPVLLNVWATYCAPCVVEMPMLDDLADDLDGKVRVLTVSQDLQGGEVVAPFFAKMNFRNLEPWMETNGELGFALASGVLPTTVLYDSSGQEVWRVVGDYDWSGAEAREAILAAVENTG